MTKKERESRMKELPKAQFVFDTLVSWGLTYVGIQLGATSISVNAEASCADEAERIRAFIEVSFPKYDEITIEHSANVFSVSWYITFI